MPRPSALKTAHQQIQRFLDQHHQRVFTGSDLAALMTSHRNDWGLPKSLGPSKFIEFLAQGGDLRTIHLQSSTGTSLRRYAWRDASDLATALSVGRSLYLCHLSAMVLHDLTDQAPSVIYVNREQSPKPTSGRLTQQGIDLAFSRKARESQFYYRFDNHRVVVLSGKSSRMLEVGTLSSPNGEQLKVTNLERTLIDIVVRPTYAGGAAQVLEAYTRARGRVSTNVLVATLRKLDYLYPYHQAIGFYMQRAGYSDQQLSLLRQFPREFDFYLVHGASKLTYDSDWRLHYPAGL